MVVAVGLTLLGGPAACGRTALHRLPGQPCVTDDDCDSHHTCHPTLKTCVPETASGCGVEVCNNRDDDCDTQIDEGCTPVDPAPPSPALDTVATPGDGTVTVSWTCPPETDLSQCVVVRTTGAPPTAHDDSGATVVGTANTPTPGATATVVDTDVVNGTPYFYAVFCRNSAGVWQETVGVDNSAVATPIGLVVDFVASDCEDGSATLVFTPPTGATACQIVRTTDDYPAGHGDGTLIGGEVTGAGASSTTDGAMTNGTTYYYAVFCRSGVTWLDTLDSSAPGVNADTAVPGPKPVFYSVGQNTTDHKTGTPTVSLFGCQATFSTAQDGPTLGVGDVVTYVAGGSQTCYLAAKLSSTTWLCTSATGHLPVAALAAPVGSISHAFSSLAAALPAGAGGAKDASHLGTTDLVGGNLVLNIPCYYDTGPDTVRVTVAGWLTGPDNTIRIYTPTDTATEVNQSQRHPGRWDDAKYRLEPATIPFNTAALTTAVPYVVVDGLQIKVASTETRVDGIGTEDGAAGDYYFANNIVVGVLTTGDMNDGICTHFGLDGQVVFAWNNIVYGWNVGTNQASAFFNSTSGLITLYAYNNTVYDSRFGFYATNGATTFAINNIVEASDSGFRVNGGIFGAGSDYNISNHADAPGTHSKNSVTVSFVDAAARDLHLGAADTVAADAGLALATDGYLPFSTDIDGEARPTGAAWDIGADER